ncbi:hypothetical protein DO97_11840 [Neosynechococcus sphagnicola sy1]|uniref:TNase-like domain-containing protein n=1 Tax=Neosynechococcus sphagnicola sy1 TaxID=1497020 RepID=A0A098TJV8_9CYAN|nr:hypothetical protein DO97_11840 [Neosynechococcus sphagnicola sy1]
MRQLNWVWGLLAISGCQGTSPHGTSVQVQRVLSGQTVEIVTHQGREQLRLIGIEAPDVRQYPWGRDARQQLAAWVESQPVVLEFDVEPRDRFHRRLVYVWRSGQLVNEQLVAQGYALVVPRSPNTQYDQRLARAQERARILGLGIWNPQQPMRQTPAEFRRQLPSQYK